MERSELTQNMADELWNNLPKSWFEDLDFIDNESEKIQTIKRMKKHLFDASDRAVQKFLDNIDEVGTAICDPIDGKIKIVLKPSFRKEA